MSDFDSGETLTATVVVDEETIIAEINTAARGPVGPSGVDTWDEIGGTAAVIPFEPGAAPTYGEGKLFYDFTDKSLTYYGDEPEAAMNIGRELWVRARNNSGATIANGKVVYISGASGQLPTIALARADALATSRVIGIATHDIEDNSFGYVTTAGEVKGLDTSAFSDGNVLYLSAATAGELTATAPTAPNRVIQVATVSHAHPSQGKLLCHPETDSVQSTGIADSTDIGRSLITAASASDARIALGAGATGAELFQAATAAAARTALGFDGMVPKIPFLISLSSDFTTVSTSFVDATGLAFSALANKNYAVFVFLLTNKTDSNGLAVRFTGPALTTKLFFRVFSSTTSTSSVISDYITAFSSPTSAINTVNGDGFLSINQGLFANGADAGTVQIQIRAVTGGTAKIYAGSYIQVTEL